MVRGSEKSTIISPRLLGIYLLTVFAMLASGCDLLFEREPGIGKRISWSRLPGWYLDDHSQAWDAFLTSCTKLKRVARWERTCLAAEKLTNPDKDSARTFFETYFDAFKLRGKSYWQSGLITGYYEPLLYGSYKQDEQFRHPIYGPPADLITIELASLYPFLKNKTLRGRLQDKRLIPFYSRAQIDGKNNPLTGNEILWLDNRDDIFFLHIQGSGRVQLIDGSYIGISYNNQNGHPYVSIGRELVNMGELELEDVSLFTIRRWLKDNPDSAEELLNKNPSYIFFTLRDDTSTGPIGSLGVPLTAERSVAIDPTIIKPGAPIWLETNVPGDDDKPYRRLVMAQDTGGAIKGALRADLFWGHGDAAERAAGIMREQGNLYVFVPR